MLKKTELMTMSFGMAAGLAAQGALAQPGQTGGFVSSINAEPGVTSCTEIPRVDNFGNDIGPICVEPAFDNLFDSMIEVDETGGSFPGDTGLDVVGFYNNLNSSQAFVSTDVGLVGAQFVDLSIVFGSAGSMSVGSSGEFDPTGMFVEIVGGSLLYDLPDGLGTGAFDFAANPLLLTVGPGGPLGNWSSATNQLVLDATATSGVIQVGNTIGEISFQFGINQVVPSPGAASLLGLAGIAAVRRRR